MNYPIITKKLTGKPVTLIHELAFSKLVSEVYGRPYNFQQQGDMMGQESLKLFTVPTKYVEDHWQAVSMKQWLEATPPGPASAPGIENFREQLRWRREFYPRLEEVVNDLHQRGLIDAGEYALHIWW